MALNFNTARTNGNNAGNNTRDNFNRATAFLNLYVTSDGGVRRKVGSVPLKDSNQVNAAIINQLVADPDAINRLKSKLELDFQLADQPEDFTLTL